MAEQGRGGRNPGRIPTDDDAAAACSMALQTVVCISLLRLGEGIGYKHTCEIERMDGTDEDALERAGGDCGHDGG